MPSFCLHAHFYQPPRGNPFADRLGADEIGHEPGAEPYDNWNEKVAAGCYLPHPPPPPPPGGARARWGIAREGGHAGFRPPLGPPAGRVVAARNGRGFG